MNETKLNEALIERLERAGYEIYRGNGWSSRKVGSDDGSPLKQGDKTDFDREIDGYWFTWSHPHYKNDIECGETYGTEWEAWYSAMSHWFDNADIPMEFEYDDSLPEGYVKAAGALTNRELGTVLAALRCYQEVRAECAGDVPEHLDDIATDGGKQEPLDADEIDTLCEKLR